VPVRDGAYMIEVLLVFFIDQETKSLVGSKILDNCFGHCLLFAKMFSNLKKAWPTPRPRREAKVPAVAASMSHSFMNSFGRLSTGNMGLPPMTGGAAFLIRSRPTIFMFNFLC
jgi:hypothetical protein